MSRHTSNESGGNDGTWFLEAVGARDRTPSSIEAVEQLESENVDTIGDAAATFDGDPGTSTSSFHPVPAPPPPPDLEHPAVRSEPPDDAAPLGEPVPMPDEALSAPLRSRRRFRWPIVIVLVLSIVGVGVAAIVLPRMVEDDALVVRQSYYDAAVDLRAYLPEAQSALDAVTNPASSDDMVSAAVPAVAELDTTAFTLESATSEPLPSAPPLVPSDPIDALEPLRVRGNVLGITGSQIATRIGSAYVYRTAIPGLLDMGTLPSGATTQEVNEISVRLAASLATAAGVLADVPSDPVFATTRSAATAAIERYAPWQDEYLASLTSEDAETATRLVDELELMHTDLIAALEADLLVFRSTADADIVTLAADLEAYLDDLTRP